jgi:uncharacterized protein (TIGR02757 family)
MDLMDNAPYDFVLGHAATDLKRFEKFVHRTFNAADLAYFVKALRHIYRKKGGIETLFNQHATEGSLQPAIHHFRKAFFELPFEKRTAKHVSDPMGGSAAKRINMYLRWMVRKDKRGVDFGIWKSIQASQLSCPLDIHSGKVARKLGLLLRAQNDARAVEELDRNLRRLDPADPVKYDFALFGLGVFEHF